MVCVCKGFINCVDSGFWISKSVVSICQYTDFVVSKKDSMNNPIIDGAKSTMIFPDQPGNSMTGRRPKNAENGPAYEYSPNLGGFCLCVSFQ